MRETINFNNSWHFYKTGKVPTDLPQDWKTVTLPHPWNAVDCQDGGNDYWRGTAMYYKQFSCPELEQDGRAELKFLGAAMTTEVWLNGQKLACHEGGYSTPSGWISPTLCGTKICCAYRWTMLCNLLYDY